MARPKKTEAATEQSEAFICPSIRVDGEKHILEQIFEESPEKMPEMKAVGYCRVGDMRHNWVSFTATIKGNKVLKLEVGEPDMRDIADEMTKIAFVQTFSDQDVV